MTYNPPTNLTNTMDLFSWINSYDITKNLFFPGILLVIFVIIVTKLMYRDESFSRAFSSASFVCMIISVLLRTINLVNTTVMVIFIILTSISVVWMHVENTR